MTSIPSSDILTTQRLGRPEWLGCLKLLAVLALAARSLSVLVSLVILSIFSLAPGPGIRVLGAEILVLGLVLLGGAVYVTVRAMTSETQTSRGQPADGHAHLRAADW